MAKMSKKAVVLTGVGVAGITAAAVAATLMVKNSKKKAADEPVVEVVVDETAGVSEETVSE